MAILLFGRIPHELWLWLWDCRESPGKCIHSTCWLLWQYSSLRSSRLHSGDWHQQLQKESIKRKKRALRVNILKGAIRTEGRSLFVRSQVRSSSRLFYWIVQWENSFREEAAVFLWRAWNSLSFICLPDFSSSAYLALSTSPHPAAPSLILILSFSQFHPIRAADTIFPGNLMEQRPAFTFGKTVLSPLLWSSSFREQILKWATEIHSLFICLPVSSSAISPFPLHLILLPLPWFWFSLSVNSIRFGQQTQSSLAILWSRDPHSLSAKLFSLLFSDPPLSESKSSEPLNFSLSLSPRGFQCVSCSSPLLMERCYDLKLCFHPLLLTESHAPASHYRPRQDLSNDPSEGWKHGHFLMTSFIISGTSISHWANHVFSH